MVVPAAIGLNHLLKVTRSDDELKFQLHNSMQSS
jgi:hypothetical protein